MRSSPLDSMPGQQRLPRQKTAEGSLSPGPSGSGRDRNASVFERLAQDGARRYRAFSPPEHAMPSQSKRGLACSPHCDPWPPRRSPRHAASPSPTRDSDCEVRYYPRGPFSPSKGQVGSLPGEEGERRNRQSPNVSLVKQRRSTSEGARGDATLVEIVGFLGEEKTADSNQAHSSATAGDGGSPSCTQLSVATATEKADDPAKMTPQEEVKRLRAENAKLKKHVEELSRQDGNQRSRTMENVRNFYQKNFDTRNSEVELYRKQLEEERRARKEEAAQSGKQIEEARIEVQVLRTDLDMQKRQAAASLDASLEAQRKAADFHDKEVAKLQNAWNKERAEFKSQIWEIDSQLRLERTTVALTSPAEAARILKVSNDSAIARNVALEYELAALTDERDRLARDHEKLLTRFDMLLGASPAKRDSQASAAGGGA